MKKEQRNEERMAQLTTELLESQEGPQLSAEQQQVFELGELVRQSANSDLPESNPELRKLIAEQLASSEESGYGTSTYPVSSLAKEAKPTKTNRRSLFWIAAPIAVVTAAGLMITSMIWMDQPLTESMQLSDGTLMRYQEGIENNEATQLARIESVTSWESTKPLVESLGEKGWTFYTPYEASGPKPASPNVEGRPAFQSHAPKANPQPLRLPVVVDESQSYRFVESPTPTDRFKAKATPSLIAKNSASDNPVPLASYRRRDVGLHNEIQLGEYNLQVNQTRRYEEEAKSKIAAMEKQVAAIKADSDGDGELDSVWVDLGFALPEQKSNEQYAPIQENHFIRALGGSAISTFSIDVDTASYANMRRFINSGQLPPRDSIRIEEMVNYFNYDYPQPKGNDPFSVNMELASCPWDSTHKLLRVGLKGKDIHVNERPATNLVFLIDVSGSMNDPNKLPLLKQGFRMMVEKLNENDRVAIVTYAGNAGVVLEPTSGDQTQKICNAIQALTPGGSTHGSAGIELAYKLAQQHFIKDGVNKVMLATDGDLNVGITENNALVNLIKQKASEDVFLTVLGFGTGNLKDAKMEQLADNGNGMYAYIDGLREARKVLVQQLSGSLVTIAKDVKLQIEFNPAEVHAYRLIGYEDRALATKDFNDDKKDAGEIGAGHTVTAIYELATTDKVTFTSSAPTNLKYQQPGEPKKEQPPRVDTAKLSAAAESGELLTLAIRYKQPDANASKRIEFTLKNDDKSFGSASSDFRFASSVAAFGMLIRGSQFSGESNLATIQEIATGAIGDDKSGFRTEFLELIRKASSLR